VRAVERAGRHPGFWTRVSVPAGHVSVGTMHLAKGLEFGTVVVMACDDEVIPLQESHRVDRPCGWLARAVAQTGEALR
jgi:superfamily I DNA/RNA helicase